MSSVLEQEEPFPPEPHVAPPAPPQPLPIRPSDGAYVVTALLVGVAIVLALVDGEGDGFLPRVATIDALAGLTLAAFLVDRLLTFVPPLGARKAGDERDADLGLLRFGYGAVIASAFVALTNMQAVQALTHTDGIDDRTDRLLTVLALAGGAKGLAAITAALNPADKPTDADATTVTADAMPTPSGRAYGFGLLVLAGALVLALVTASDDTSGLELLGQELQDGGTAAVVVRFGALILAAGIIQQLIEVFMPSSRFPMPNRLLSTAAVSVALGAIAAYVLDLYLLHNLGFFGVTADMTVAQGLQASTSAERVGDALATGIIIAAGTKPLHDLSSRLRTAAKKPAGAG
jgi:hypothetical protein